MEDSLHGKIAEVIAAIGAMPKDRTVEVRKEGRLQYTYDYLSESALMNAVRTELPKRGVAVYVSVDKQWKEGNLTFVEMSMTFACGNESFTIKGQGQGSDPQDKGVYKAITGCTRYMLWKQFLIPTEMDDPVQSVDERADPRPAPVVRAGDLPVGLGEAIGWLENFMGDPKAWIKEGIELLYPEVAFEKWGDLDSKQQVDILQRLQLVVGDLEEVSAKGHGFDDSVESQEVIRSSFSKRFEGLKVSGPDEFSGPVPF